VTIGIAPNRMLAKLAGKTVKPAGVVRLAEADGRPRFLIDRPARDVPGVGLVHGQRLAR
jgi:nucleotidyltransferase/DNA polymerase involved in DNA repair